MVQKIKRFVVFYMFSLVFAIMGGKVAKHHHSLPVIEENSAEAKCCPSGTVRLDRDGNCLSSGGIIIDETCY